MPNPRVTNAFKDFSSESFWKLLIDGNRQASDGPLGFDEKEPGYLRGMMKGLDFICKDTSTLSVGYLSKLHDYCTEPVLVVQHADTVDGDIEIKTSFDRGIDQSTKSFGLISEEPRKNVSKEGLSELRNKMLRGDNSFCLERSGTTEQITAKDKEALEDLDALYAKIQTGEWAVVTTSIPKKEMLKAKLQAIINDYETNIKMADTAEKKIEVIANCVHELELAHPFADGNCRTLVVLLTNKLLIQENLSPAILENPNRFDAYSVKELCSEISHGMVRFNECKNTSNLYSPVLNEDTIVLYLKDNDALMEIMIESALSKSKNWSNVNPTEKERAISLVKQALQQIDSEGLTTKQINAITQKLPELVDASIYKKSPLQKSLTLHLKNNNYGICFNGDISVTAVLYNRKKLDVADVTQVLKTCIRTPMPQSEFKSTLAAYRERAKLDEKENTTNYKP